MPGFSSLKAVLGLAVLGQEEFPNLVLLGEVWVPQILFLSVFPYTYTSKLGNFKSCSWAP